ncbi:Uncharacterised protein [Mycobacteroides abscessus subsp. abscessus]|nr:Uncharacterised protein [Mycobacteroides abscessus subsp. abscessus]
MRRAFRRVRRRRAERLRRLLGLGATDLRVSDLRADRLRPGRVRSNRLRSGRVPRPVGPVRRGRAPVGRRLLLRPTTSTNSPQPRRPPSRCSTTPRRRLHQRRLHRQTVLTGSLHRCRIAPLRPNATTLLRQHAHRRTASVAERLPMDSLLGSLVRQLPRSRGRKQVRNDLVVSRRSLTTADRSRVKRLTRNRTISRASPVWERCTTVRRNLEIRRPVAPSSWSRGLLISRVRLAKGSFRMTGRHASRRRSPSARTESRPRPTSRRSPLATPPVSQVVHSRPQAAVRRRPRADIRRRQPEALRRTMVPRTVVPAERTPRHLSRLRRHRSRGLPEPAASAERSKRSVAPGRASSQPSRSAVA